MEQQLAARDCAGEGTHRSGVDRQWGSGREDTEAETREAAVVRLGGQGLGVVLEQRARRDGRAGLG